jgi:hypothetical protein
MNRPQYFFTTPPGFQDVPFVQPVNPGQDVFGLIPPGQFLSNYVITLDTDAPQIYRSLFWQGLEQGQGAYPSSGSVQIHLRDVYGNELTDGYVPIWLYCWGAGSTPADGGSGRAKVFESELYCLPGSVLLIDFYNPDTANFAFPGLLEFRGVKRWPEGCA